MRRAKDHKARCAEEIYSGFELIFQESPPDAKSPCRLMGWRRICCIATPISPDVPRPNGTAGSQSEQTRGTSACTARSKAMSGRSLCLAREIFGSDVRRAMTAGLGLDAAVGTPISALKQVGPQHKTGKVREGVRCGWRNTDSKLFKS